MEALQYTLEPHEFSKVQSEDIFDIELTIVPSQLENQFILAKLKDNDDSVKAPFFPRLILKITLDPKTYPSKDPPKVEVLGFFRPYTYFFVSKLHQRFEVGYTVLFDWFTYAKNELLFEADNPYEYSKEFFNLQSN